MRAFAIWVSFILLVSGTLIFAAPVFGPVPSGILEGPDGTRATYVETDIVNSTVWTGDVYIGATVDILEGATVTVSEGTTVTINASGTATGYNPGPQRVTNWMYTAA
jgi:hypothetical protein